VSLNKPYPHIYRPGLRYVASPYYEARESELGINCLASYRILKHDLKSIFEYIEPQNANFKTFSHRTFELLVRACIEVESLCKLIFKQDRVELKNCGNMVRYSDLEGAMHLSKYEIGCYGFTYPAFIPFESFSGTERKHRSPSWYKAYNAVKHNRTENFAQASLENVIHAVGAVYVLLLAQFGCGFDDENQSSSCFGNYVCAYPDLFGIKSEPQWTDSEQYQFDWESLKKSQDSFDYCHLPEIS
jgi:hypothetical protein